MLGRPLTFMERISKAADAQLAPSRQALNSRLSLPAATGHHRGGHTEKAAAEHQQGRGFRTDQLDGSTRREVSDAVNVGDIDRVA